MGKLITLSTLILLLLTRLDAFAGTTTADTVIESSKKEWLDMCGKIKEKEEQMDDEDSKDSLKKVLANLDSLYYSIQRYGIVHINKNPGYTTYYIQKDIIFFNIQENNIPNFIHETTHGIQYQHGSIVFKDTLAPVKDSIVDGVGDDFGDEIEAYKAQFAYDPASVSSLPNLYHTAYAYKDMDAVWLLGLIDSAGNQLYKPDSLRGVCMSPVNIWTDQQGMHNAWPLQPLYPAGYILGEDTHYLNYPAKLRKWRIAHGLTHQAASSSPKL
ncbi:hypothetical protein [Puia dinghuensis]|uniref:DUF4157 domain-containing protein n=1 Tax=Puia dinghuensis TaxID=1792502 RepID=A0A8J2UE20_9BACT|nr:hypothetical protein [Puia dinghuensis]GGB04789.1 hypothetical protein GCM10011511_30140 [Puia dinghuensis]